MSNAKSTKKASKKPISQEKIINDFNALRQNQREIATKISELEADCKEHDLVIDALKDVKDKSRRCFRMVGGVLVERTVADVLPELSGNREKLGELVTTLSKQLELKGKEINEFRELHNIRVRGEETEKPNKGSSASDDSKTTGVLVSEKTGSLGGTLDSVD